MFRYSKLYWWVGLGLFLAGLAIRIIAIVEQPLWLDEQFSIYFARTLPWLQFFVSTPDSHPGLYYFLLKIALYFSEDVSVLRFVTVLVPTLCGTALLVLVAHTWQKLSGWALVAIIAGLWLNPFLVNYSWQLRMYGLLVLGVGLSFWSTQLLLKKFNKKNALIVIICFIFLQATSYIAYFWTLGWLVWQMLHLSKKRWSNAHNLVLFIAINAFFQFMIQSAGQVKTTFYWAVSWVTTPTWTNGSALLKTVLGFDFNMMLVDITFGIQDALLVLLILIGAFMIVKKYFTHEQASDGYLLSFIVIPTAAIILLSFGLPFLSQRFFLHKYIPDISLFLPRVFIPIYLMLAIFFVKKVEELSLNKIVTSIIFIGIISVWIVSWNRFTVPINVTTDYQVLEEKISQYTAEYTNVLWLPSWFKITTIQPATIISPIFELQLEHSKKIEAYIIENYDENKNLQSCDPVRNAHIIMSSVSSLNLEADQLKMQKYISSCCTMKSSQKKATIWHCDK